jgi:hypothetical protein
MLREKKRLLPLQPGSEERERRFKTRHIEKRVRGKKRLEKIKFILFGSLKKILTFALPTDKEGQKRPERRMSER